MLESCLRPELASEITLQPVRRHGVDAAIFFSDIVVPLKLAGVDVDIAPGVGPVLGAPVRTADDVARLAAAGPLTPEALAPGTRLTVECITHRYTEGSREVLRGWYPNTALEMDDEKRAAKRTKFGNAKYVYPRDVMAELKAWFAAAVRGRWRRGRAGTSRAAGRGRRW